MEIKCLQIQYEKIFTFYQLLLKLIKHTKDGIYCRGVCGLVQADGVLGRGGSAVLTYSKGGLTFTQFENP